MLDVPEWHENTPEILKAIANSYLLSPINPQSYWRMHQCTLLGHKVTLDCRIPLELRVVYKGWDQTHRDAFMTTYGTKHEDHIEIVFDLLDPDFGDNLDQFFWDVGLPVLYVLDTPDKQKETATHSYDFEYIRKSKNKIPSSEIRPATYEEIKSVSSGCLAIWMNCQISQYGCEKVEDLRDGLWSRIQYNIPFEIWADRQFNEILVFLRAFLPAEDRKVGLTKSRKGGHRSRKNTYSASGNGKSHPSS